MPDAEPPELPTEFLTEFPSEFRVEFSRTHRLVMAALYGLAAVWSVQRFVDGVWWAQVLAALVLVSGAVGLLMQFWRPPATLVSAQGLRRRRVLVPGRLVRWDEVDRIEVQGRFEGQSTLVTHDGRRIALLGVPREQAQRWAGLRG